MDNITLDRKERIQMFFNEYYFGVSTWVSILRLIGGPVVFYVGLTMYSGASDRFGIGYGAMMIVFSCYYTFKPFWWVLIKWSYYKSNEFKIEATPDKLFIQEDQSESKTEYSKFENIIKRKNYFALIVQKGFKIYLPIDKLSEQTIEVLTENSK